MTATKTRTKGQEFADTARRYFRIGPSTRRYRKDGDGSTDLHRDLIDNVMHAATIPGYFTERTQGPLALAFAAACGYEKEIAGYRTFGEVTAKVNAMTPWQFTGMLADMIDAGVSSAYQAEQFFKAMREAE